MGFNFGDLLTVAEGAIERDRKHTDDDLKIRGQMLLADKQSYINRKNKKYDSELAAFEQEDSKVKAIKSLNASMPEDGTGSAHDYAVKYNMILYPNFLNLSAKNQSNFINSTKNSMSGESGTGTIDYNNTSEKSKEYLEAEIDNVESAASEQYTNKLLDAKGNSFLINKITGIKEKPLAIGSEEINNKVDEQMKALKIAKEIDKEAFISKKLQGTIYTSSGEGVNLWATADQDVKDDFSKAWNTEMAKVTFKGIDNQEATSSITDIFAAIGADSKAFYTIKNVNDKNIIKLNSPGRVITNYIETAFQDEKNKMTAASAYNFLMNDERYQGDARGNIYHLSSEAVVYKAISNNIVDRSYYLIGDHFPIYGTDGKPEAVTIVPLSVLNINNDFKTFEKDDGGKMVASSINLNRAEVKDLAAAWGNIFSTEAGYNNVLKLFSDTKELSKARYKKYKDNPNEGMAYISKMMNQDNILMSNAGQSLWLALAASIDESKLPDAMNEVIQDMKTDENITDNFKPTKEINSQGENSVKYWSPNKNSWMDLSETKWDSLSKEDKAIIKSNFPRVYEIIQTFE
tara:strand:- start:1633 stop:3351 length:1719 start_codon:yes stop_codon:yes gene_type:complete